MKKTMFLLEFDCANMECDLPDFPEITLWKSAEEALAVALEQANACGPVIDMSEAVIDLVEGKVFLPGFCEILPITMSSLDKITWMGSKWTPMAEKIADKNEEV